MAKYEKSLTLNIKTGKDAELKPIVTDGKITLVEIQSKGQEYTSAPDLEVVGIGTGLGAKLRAVVSDGKIVEVVDINKINNTIIDVFNNRNIFQSKIQEERKKVLYNIGSSSYAGYKLIKEMIHQN